VLGVHKITNLDLNPLPTAESLSQMPWGAPLDGLVGSFAVAASLLFVGKIAAGAFAGLTITANILMSLVIDKFGEFGMNALTVGRLLGAAMMIGSIALISCF
jgi:transporter family-2 protein